MKQTFHNLLLLTPLLFLAAMASAYSNPTGTPPNMNTDGPIIISSDNQAKNGGLSVLTFNVEGNAQFKDIAFIKGAILGGKAATVGDSALNFGTKDTPTSVAITGPMLVSGAIATPTLTQNGGHVCADTVGIIVNCEPKNPPKLTVSFEYNRSYAAGGLNKPINFIALSNIDSGVDYVMRRSGTVQSSGDTVTDSGSLVVDSGVYEITEVGAVCAGEIYFQGTKIDPTGFQFVLDQNYTDQQILIECIGG